MKKVVIVAAKRTPIGSFLGNFINTPAIDLGITAVKGTLEKTNISLEQIDEVFFGNVLQAGLGQAPARQITLGAGISDNTPSTTINKVCASGMKSVSLAAQSIGSGANKIVVAGGTENMSQVPHYTYLRNGLKLGNSSNTDGLLKDGLINVYDQNHMGVCAELCAEKHNISRKEQDLYAIESYKRAKKSWDENLIADEISVVNIPQKKGENIIIDTDEEYTKVDFDKLSSLRPVFKKDGTVTAGNASTLNDGAAALILIDEDEAKALGIKPIARILSFADAACTPEYFTTAPSLAIPKALKKVKLNISDVDLFEINEAFSVVSLANNKLLSLHIDKVNIFGGAVSIGHPLGCSGARIIVTLINALNKKNKKIGVAGICNGGGGASAMVIEKL